MKKIIRMAFPIILVIMLYSLNIIPHIYFTNDFFHIQKYNSHYDKDNDGIDDQIDILNGARNYIKKRPKYKSKYYASGYTDDNYGTCTDVIAFALKEAGYDLMQLVNDDIINNRNNYNIDVIDKNIDFRRVENLNIYFKNNSISLTTNLKDYKEWQGGDIVVFTNHIAIVSDKRNYMGVPFIIHHSNRRQLWYEEDTINRYKIIGHYRIS